MNRPYAPDWVKIDEDLLHSAERGLWFVLSTQKVYDRTGAEHNGIIGQGARLKQMIQNQRNK